MKPVAAALLSALILAAPALASERFEVAMDHAKILRLSRPATAVVVGNPAIADATIHDGQMLFITGKSFGSTNFIAVDKDGKTILAEELHVLPPKSQVTLHRASLQNTYVCGDKCEQIPGLGDDSDTFTRLMNQQNQKASQGQSAADQN